MCENQIIRRLDAWLDGTTSRPPTREQDVKSCTASPYIHHVVGASILTTITTDVTDAAARGDTVNFMFETSWLEMETGMSAVNRAKHNINHMSLALGLM